MFSSLISKNSNSLYFLILLGSSSKNESTNSPISIIFPSDKNIGISGVNAPS